MMRCLAQAVPTLHPGDKIDVVVFNHPEISSSPTIAADGSVTLAAAGIVVAAQGLSPAQLANRIQARLAPFVKMVSVQVALENQAQTIFVAGGPGGVLAYEPGESLVSILDRLQYDPAKRTAGMTAPALADQHAPLDLLDGPVDYSRVSLLRDGRTIGPFDTLALRAAGQRGPSLLPGDTIELVDKPIAVSVHGDVGQPGTAYLNVNDPLARAIDQAGGTTPTSTQTAITLVRAGNAQVVSLGNPVFTLPAQSGDQLIVPRAPRVDVLGTVVKPGETYLRGNASLVGAIYYAGGPDRFANLKSVQLTRNGVKTEYNLARLQKGHDGDNPPLQDGDVVFVPQGSTLDASLIFQAIASLGFLVYR